MSRKALTPAMRRAVEELKARKVTFHLGTDNNMHPLQANEKRSTYDALVRRGIARLDTTDWRMHVYSPTPSNSQKGS